MLPTFAEPARWIAMMRASIRMAEEHFTSDRMVKEYRKKIGFDDGPGLPLPETLKALDLEDLIPVVDRIKAERGLAAATS